MGGRDVLSSLAFYLISRATVGRWRSKCAWFATTGLLAGFLPFKGYPFCVLGYGSKIAAVTFRLRFNSRLLWDQ